MAPIAKAEGLKDLNLRTSFMGIPLANPFLLASAPTTASAKRITGAADIGWAGAVTKTLTTTAQYCRNITPSLASSQKTGWRRLGMLNNELVTAGSFDQWCSNTIPSIREEAGAGFCLGVSIMEGPSPADWESTARQASGTGASFLELNVSCQHGAPEKFRGSHIGDDPNLVAQVVRAACAGSQVPVAVKLNALSSSLTEAGAAAIANGAQGLVTTNTFRGLPSVSAAASLSQNALGPLTPMGVSGGSTLPTNRLAVATLATNLGCDLLAVGGISSAADVVDYLMLGASGVQIATAVILHGPRLLDRLLRGITDYFTLAGETSVAALVGSALHRFMEADSALKVTEKMVAVVDMSRCTLCDACVGPCAWAGANCITTSLMDLTIDIEQCTGCGLCVMICPTAALSLSANVDMP